MKAEISFAQNYFPVQTCKAELITQRLMEGERVRDVKKVERRLNSEQKKALNARNKA